MLEVVAYAYGDDYGTGVLTREASHPLALCREVPVSIYCVGGAETNVKASRPAIYCAFVLAYVVGANADDGVHVPICRYLQRYLEVAIDIHRTLLLANVADTGLYVGQFVMP